MNYGNILYYDVANGPGCRTSLFVSGCRNHCKGCFNQMTWDFNYGTPFTEETKNIILHSLQHIGVTGLTILGGEPMEPENQPVIADLLITVKQTLPHINIWLYSGYLWEQLTGQIQSPVYTEPYTKQILNCLDVLVDGKFDLEKKNISLQFRGSENQRIINVPESIKNKTVIKERLY